MEKSNKDIEQRSSCPLTLALDEIGDKWSLIILRDLMFTPKRSYTELLSSAEGIATNILASRLQKLCANGMVRRACDEANARKAKYYLTRKGIDLLPVLYELQAWMIHHNEDASLEDCASVFEPGKRSAQLKKWVAQMEEDHLPKER